MKGDFFEKLRVLFSKRRYTCDSCGAEVFDYPKHRLCKDCIEYLIKVEGKVCTKCGRKNFADGVCLSCKRNMPKFDLGIAPFVYEGLASALINRFKNGERYLRDFFGEEMEKVLLERAKDYALEDAVVTFVPMTEERRLKRGYNQAEELAKVVAIKMGTELATDVLIKTRDTSEQKNLKAGDRAENLKGSFRVHRRDFVKDRTVLLIDDILTTGCTGSECARVLKNAGAKRVVFLTAVSVPMRKNSKMIK